MPAHNPTPKLSAPRDWRGVCGQLLAPIGRRLTANCPRVLFLHRIGEGSERLLPKKAFEAQLQYLKRHFNVMPLELLADAMVKGKRIPDRSVALTFDDGYADFAEEAYPLLCAYQVPATLFVVSRFASGAMWLWFDRIRYVCEHSGRSEVSFGVRGAHWLLSLVSPSAQEKAWDLLSSYCLKLTPTARDELIGAFAEAAEVMIPREPPGKFRSLTFDELRGLDRSIVGFGAHTRTHPILSACPPPEQKEEVRGSKEDLERELSREISLFAYPNGAVGDFDVHSMRFARESGFIAAFTTRAGLIETGADPFALPRIGATPHLGFFQREIDGLTHLKAHLPRFGAGRSKGAA